MATPRSNSACTLGSQEVGKLTLPSFSSCWLHVLPVNAMVMRLAAIIRYFGFMVVSPMENARARARTCTFRTGKKDVVYYGVKCLPTASALPAPTERRFRHIPFKGQLLGNIPSLSVSAEGQEWLKRAHSRCVRSSAMSTCSRLTTTKMDPISSLKHAYCSGRRLWAPDLPGSAKTKTVVSVWSRFRTIQVYPKDL